MNKAIQIKNNSVLTRVCVGALFLFFVISSNAQPIMSIETDTLINNPHKEIGLRLIHQNTIYVPDNGYYATFAQGFFINEQNEFEVDLNVVDSVTSRVSLLSEDFQLVNEFLIKSKSDTLFWLAEDVLFDDAQNQIIIFGKVGKFQSPSYVGFVNDNFFMIRLNMELNEIDRIEFGYEFSKTSVQSVILNRNRNVVVSGHITPVPLNFIEHHPYIAEFSMEGEIINLFTGEQCQAGYVAPFVQDSTSGNYYDFRSSTDFKIFDENLNLLEGDPICRGGGMEKAIIVDDNIYTPTIRTGSDGVDVLQAYGLQTGISEKYVYETDIFQNLQFPRLRGLAAIDADNIFFGNTIHASMCPPLPCDDWTATLYSVNSNGEINWRYILHENETRLAASEIVIGPDNAIIYIFNKREIINGKAVTSPYYLKFDQNGNDITSATEQPELPQKNLNIFPNPTNGIIYFSDTRSHPYRVLDITGKQLINGEDSSINLSAYNNQMLIVLFEEDGNWYAERVVVLE